MKQYRVPFGVLKISESAKRRINDIAESDWVSEGQYVAEFEAAFADKFLWRHAIMTSSGTDAGIVVWAAIREMEGICHGTVEDSDYIGYVFTPACAFVAVANCLLAAGLSPAFVDIKLDTLNMDPRELGGFFSESAVGIQFVPTLGKPTGLDEVEKIAAKKHLWLVSDSCEAHGAMLNGQYADHYADASIYSFYAAHLIIAGEGGMICTNNDDLAAMCRSVKSHGRPPGGYFDFLRTGYNSRANEFCAAVALGDLERFDETMEQRREVRAKMVKAMEQFEDKIVIYRDAPNELVAPHAFGIVLRDEYADMKPLYEALDSVGIQVKSLFGSLPSMHRAFAFTGNKEGEYPVAEHVHRGGLHWGCHQYITDDDIVVIQKTVGQFLGDK